jgi:alkylation response protein AidB-like acyl-CoA dehydrogenase
VVAERRSRRTAGWDRDRRFPAELFAGWALGLMGVCVPEELGGAGADFLSYVLVLEELSRADAGVGVTVAVHTSAATLPIVAFGSDEQRQRFVPPLASGSVLGAFALTEPESGSDAGALRTVAVPQADGWAPGTKQWITNGTRTRHVHRVRPHGPVHGRRARRQRLRPRRRARRGDP